MDTSGQFVALLSGTGVPEPGASLRPRRATVQFIVADRPIAGGDDWGLAPGRPRPIANGSEEECSLSGTMACPRSRRGPDGPGRNRAPVGPSPIGAPRERPPARAPDAPDPHSSSNPDDWPENCELAFSPPRDYGALRELPTYAAIGFATGAVLWRPLPWRDERKARRDRDRRSRAETLNKP